MQPHRLPVTNNVTHQQTLVKSDPLRTAWADWLNQYQWTYWTTFTTRYELSFPSARRMAGKIGNYVIDDDDNYMFWAAEEFDIRNGAHIHALIRTRENKKDLWQWAFKAYGRALILPYDPKLGAGHYISKYISKRMVDYDWISGTKQMQLFKRRALR